MVLSYFIMGQWVTGCDPWPTDPFPSLWQTRTHQDMHQEGQQEAQLPLRNRASAMYFFVAKLLCMAVMTCSYVYHLQSLYVRWSPLIYEAHCFQHATATRAHGARPHCGLMSLFLRIPADTCINFILPETRVHAEDLHRWHYVSVFVSFHAILEVARSQPAKPVLKQNLTRNSCSRSFKVMHFGITEKPTTDCISPYNKDGLISKLSEK